MEGNFHLLVLRCGESRDPPTPALGRLRRERSEARLSGPGGDSGARTRSQRASGEKSGRRGAALHLGRRIQRFVARGEKRCLLRGSSRRRSQAPNGREALLFPRGSCTGVNL
ncbi:hypothetical protein AOLI_G00256260 [Acnodon oligacanthus]